MGEQTRLARQAGRPALSAAIAAIAFVAAGVCFAQPGWQPLLPDSGLGSWRETPFRGAGKVQASDGVLALGLGGPLTGITWSGEFPRADYEIRLQARRVQGGDFFASLTFPVGDSFGTFVTG